MLTKCHVLMLHAALIAESGCCDDLVSTILSVTSDELDDAGLLNWLRGHLNTHITPLSN